MNFPEIPIIYENDSFIIIDKPPNLVVNRSESVKEPTLQDWTEAKLKININKLAIPQNKSVYDIESEFYNRAGIVHRLDKDTSGLIIISKSPRIFNLIKQQFQNREVIKKYITLLHGKINEAGIIKATVGRLPWNRLKFGVIAGGREAETKYNLISFYSLNENYYSLVEVNPLTGRTHQIRIHFKYIGHPLVSDKLYAGRKVYKQDINICPRLFLHAFYLKISDPETGKSSEFHSKLPEDLEKCLSRLNKI